MTRKHAAAEPRACRKKVGHVVLHDDDHQDAVEHRDIAEVEAESFALLIAAAHSMDTCEYSIPHWSSCASSRPGHGPVQTLQSTAMRVTSAAVGVPNRLDTVQAPGGTPPGLNRQVAPAAASHLSAAAARTSPQLDVDRGSIALDQLAWCGKELAHVLMHDPDDDEVLQHRGIREVEAESVALMIGAAHGMDTTGYTIPYVSTWAARVDGQEPAHVVQATGERVRKTALAILDQLDTPQVGDGTPPGLERDATMRPPARPTQAATVSSLAESDRPSAVPVLAGREL